MSDESQVTDAGLTPPQKVMLTRLLRQPLPVNLKTMKCGLGLFAVASGLKVLEGMPALKTLTLKQSKATQAGFDALGKARPDLKVSK